MKCPVCDKGILWFWRDNTWKCDNCKREFLGGELEDLAKSSSSLAIGFVVALIFLGVVLIALAQFVHP